MVQLIGNEEIVLTIPSPSPEEIFLGTIETYIQNRIIWLLQDLNRNEGVNEDKIKTIKTAINKCFVNALSKSPKTIEYTPVADSPATISLSEHIQKMTNTLRDQGRFSPKDNPQDRFFIIHIMRHVLHELGIIGVHFRHKTRQRELIVAERAR